MNSNIKYIILIALIFLFSLSTPIVIKNVSAAPSNNPIFATIQTVQQMITDALTPINNLLNNHEERLDELESKVTELEGKINELEVTPTPTEINFFDNFNDGNTDGWWLGYSLANPANNGNWRVESGELLQDTGYDGVISLVENSQFSDQTIETRLKVNDPSGSDGVLLWFQDDNNLVYVVVSGNGVAVGENINGTWNTSDYPFPSFIFGTWYDLKVVADSTSGNLDVYLDENYFFTHTVTTSNRTGQSGVINGNAGGAFDDFKLTY